MLDLLWKVMMVMPISIFKTTANPHCYVTYTTSMSYLLTNQSVGGQMVVSLRSATTSSKLIMKL